MARREKKPVHKVVMTEGKRNIIQQLLQEYDIETAEDIQDALKDLLGGTIEDIYGFETSEGFISDVTDKWTMSIRNWGQVYGELSIYVRGKTSRITESVCMMRRTFLTSALDMPEIMSYI